jgi:multidrug efflux pump subunit AcrA (membrane-fusion protein)
MLNNYTILRDILKHRHFQVQHAIESYPWTKRSTKLLFYSFIFWGMFLLFAPWQQTSSGTGRVIAYSPMERQQSIDAPVDGRIKQWFVIEGSYVKQGDPIVEVIDNDPHIIDRLTEERHAVESRLNAARISIEMAKLNLDRQKSLAEQGLSSERMYELSRLEHARYLTDEANARAELVRIQTRLARQNSQLVRAPRNGFILRITAGEHSVLVKASEPIATLVPETESRAVELWIEGRDIPLICIGQHVRLQFEGWPAIQFSGWPIASIGTFKGVIAVIDAADNGSGKFRVLIQQDPKEPQKWPNGSILLQGIRVQGWVLMGQVKLGYELWRLFNGFPPNLTKPDNLQKK